MLRRFDFSFGLDGGVPLAARLADGGVASFTQDVSRFAVAHPSQFRQFDAPVLVVYLESLRDTKALRLAFLLELGKAGSLLKVVCVTSANRSFHSWNENRDDGVSKWILGAEVRMKRSRIHQRT